MPFNLVKLNAHLEAVLVRHKLLGLMLVGRLGRAPRRLRGRRAPGGAVPALGQVQVSHLDADLVAHYVLQLQREVRRKRGGRGGEVRPAAPAAHRERGFERAPPRYLPDDALDELVHGEGDVSVDGEHFPQRVLVLRGLHVPVKQIPDHLQEGRVVILHFDVHWRAETL